MRNNLKGFTLIELVLVVAILGVLAVTALPNIFNIQLQTARDNSRDAVAGAVQTAISLYGAQQVSLGNNVGYPADLGGTAGAATRANPLFGSVLQGGVTRDWTKTDATCWIYTGGGVTDNYKYDSTAGTFVFVTSCP